MRLQPIALALALGAALLRTGTLAAQTDKPSLVVMGFESGTVSAQVQDRRGFLAILTSMHGGENEKYDPSQLGTGIADMLVEKLLEGGQFRLLERKSDGTPPNAEYIMTGSVTKFGFEETNFGGAAANIATLGLLSYKQHKTEVALTARVIRASTGEIIVSVSGDGVSGKGGGLRIAGIGANGGGGVDVNSANFRATAIGEATERAVEQLAERIVAKRFSF